MVIKRNLKLSLLVVAVLILSWATPSFCPLTFVQANTLKSLPRTADNLAKIRAAVEAAGPKDRSGLNVIAKAFSLGASASKEEILAAIQAELDRLTPASVAVPGLLSRVTGGYLGGSTAAVAPVVAAAESRLERDTVAAAAAVAGAQAALAKVEADEKVVAQLDTMHLGETSATAAAVAGAGAPTTGWRSWVSPTAWGVTLGLVKPAPTAAELAEEAAIREAQYELILKHMNQG